MFDDNRFVLWCERTIVSGAKQCILRPNRIKTSAKQRKRVVIRQSGSFLTQTAWLLVQTHGYAAFKSDSLRNNYCGRGLDIKKNLFVLFQKTKKRTSTHKPESAQRYVNCGTQRISKFSFFFFVLCLFFFTLQNRRFASRDYQKTTPLLGKTTSTEENHKISGEVRRRWPRRTGLSKRLASQNKN